MIYVGFSTTDLLVSKIIRWFTQSPTSHAWIKFDLHGIPMVLEASLFGIRLVSWEKFQTTEKIVDLFKVSENDSDINKLLPLLGSAYDFGGLFGSVFVIVGRWFKKKWHNPLENSSAVFCSELVVQWLQMLEHPVSVGLISEDVAPSDLLKLFIDFRNKNQ